MISASFTVLQGLNTVPDDGQIRGTCCEMPFTLSHPLAVVPLRRTGLVYSALIIGSMSPDFEYMLRPFEDTLPLNLDSHASHTFTGLFAICLPASLAWLWLWHELLKRPLLELAPESHRLRLAPLTGEFSFGPWRRFLLICVSILIGAATHMIWDSFTHSWGWPVQHWAFLQDRVSLLGISSKPVHRWLQHGSGILGLLALTLIYLQWIRHATPAKDDRGRIPPSTRVRLLLIGAAIALICGMTFAWFRSPPAKLDHIRGFVVRTAVVAMAMTVMQAILFALWFRCRALRP